MGHDWRIVFYRTVSHPIKKPRQSGSGPQIENTNKASTSSLTMSGRKVDHCLELICSLSSSESRTSTSVSRSDSKPICLLAEAVDPCGTWSLLSMESETLRLSGMSLPAPVDSTLSVVEEVDLGVLFLSMCSVKSCSIKSRSFSCNSSWSELLIPEEASARPGCSGCWLAAWNRAPKTRPSFNQIIHLVLVYYILKCFRKQSGILQNKA